MEPKDYIVTRLDGDYAYLQLVGEEQLEPKLVARALLPENIKECSKLHYEMLQYELV